MKCTETFIDGLLEIDLDIYSDERGFFYEAFNQKLFNEITLSNYNFVQDNISFSKKNVLRGLHYQLNNSQAKLVQVIKGKIFDVVVDLRRESKTFGNYYSLILSNENKKQLFVPKNFAHGFVTLEEENYVTYKTSDYYDNKSERTLLWNDPELNIDWNLDQEPILSEKDKKGLNFKNIEIP